MEAMHPRAVLPDDPSTTHTDIEAARTVARPIETVIEYISTKFFRNH